MRRSIVFGVALLSIAWLPSASVGGDPTERQSPARAPADKVDVDVETEEYLQYTIPSDAIKIGPIPYRRGETKRFNCFDRQKSRLLHEIDPAVSIDKQLVWVGIERFSIKTKKLVQRELFTNIDGRRARHGVQREWYEDGRPKSEEPYRDGLMHGLFKCWDEQGRLVGCYRMAHGTGVRKIYFPNGRLREEYHYRDGEFDGPHYQFHDNGQIWSMGEASRGRWLGGLGFHPDGELAGFWDASSRGMQLCGTLVDFAQDGKVSRQSYEAHGERVSREEYLKRAESDPKLPKLEKDANAYKKRVDERVRAIIKRYKDMPPVKIPLGCAEEGRPSFHHEMSKGRKHERCQGENEGNHAWRAKREPANNANHTNRTGSGTQNQ